MNSQDPIAETPSNRMTEFVSLQFTEEVATVTLTTPAMPLDLFRQLRDIFTTVSLTSTVRAVVLRSSAPNFSYGLDIPATVHEHSDLFSGKDATIRTQLLELIRDLQDCMETVVRCPVPVICAIHGHCIGAGLDLITCCDIRLSSANATFSVRETRIGIVADLGTLQRLPAIIGQGHTRELALTGCDIDADRAEKISLVTHCYQNRDSLHSAADQMAQQIARNPPLTVRGVKEVLNFGRDHGAKAGLRYVSAWNAAFLATEDLEEAMAAFVEKRDPKYTGR